MPLFFSTRGTRLLFRAWSNRPWSIPDWAERAGARATARAPAIDATAAKEGAVIPSGVPAVVCGWGKSDRQQIPPKTAGATLANYSLPTLQGARYLISS